MTNLSGKIDGFLFSFRMEKRVHFLNAPKVVLLIETKALSVSIFFPCKEKGKP